MSTTSAQTLEHLSDRYWQALLKYQPTWATALGDRRYDHVLPDLSPAARNAYCDELQVVLTECRNLDTSTLLDSEVITLEILKGTLQIEVDLKNHPDYRWSVNPLFGTHVWLSDLASKQPVDSPENVQKLLSRFKGIPQLIKQECQNLAEGAPNKQTAYHVAVERSVAQLDRVLSTPPERSSFVPPSLLKDDLSAEEKLAYNQLVDVIKADVFPAMREYQSFLQNTYLPAARTSPGVGSIPGGSDYYDYCIRLYTGISRSPEEVHQIGMDEMARIQQEMREIGERAAGVTDIRALADYFNGQPNQHASNKAEILDYNKKLVAMAWDALPQYFEELPAANCEVCVIEDFREADSPSGYYERAPADGSRPGRYYVNTHEPQNRPLFNMEALAFHEAVPGHHLQIALAQKLDDLPKFRRYLGDTAYIEGWALYCERFCDEIGLYSGDASRFGMLSFQAWRAARLVLDTGLHTMNWSREKAIDFLYANTALTSTEATIEVDRYISMPGQALAYMLGRLEIDALRNKAKQTLAEDFDIKTFHSQILNNGAVPLHTLRGLVDQWLSSSTSN